MIIILSICTVLEVTSAGIISPLIFNNVRYPSIMSEGIENVGEESKDGYVFLSPLHHFNNNDVDSNKNSNVNSILDDKYIEKHDNDNNNSSGNSDSYQQSTTHHSDHQIHRNKQSGVETASDIASTAFKVTSDITVTTLKATSDITVTALNSTISTAADITYTSVNVATDLADDFNNLLVMLKLSKEYHVYTYYVCMYYLCFSVYFCVIVSLFLTLSFSLCIFVLRIVWMNIII